MSTFTTLEGVKNLLFPGLMAYASERFRDGSLAGGDEVDMWIDHLEDALLVKRTGGEPSRICYRAELPLTRDVIASRFFASMNAILPLERK